MIALEQYSQEIHTNIQEQFCWVIVWPPLVLPNAPLVSISSTSRYAFKSTTTIYHHTQDISLCTCPRPPQFYSQATSPFGVPYIGTWKARQRRSWSDHSINAWNFGTSMEHPRAFIAYRKRTRAEIFVNTLLFKHKHPTSPILTTEDTVTQTAKILTDSVTANSNITNSEQI